MSERAVLTQEEISKITRRVFGRAGKKACADSSVIECRSWACQVKNRCRLSVKRNQKAAEAKA